VWDRYDLKAYGITVTPLPSHQFFPQGTNVPLTGLDPMILGTSCEVDAKLPNVPRETYLFFVHLNTVIRYDDKVATDGLTLDILRAAGFVTREDSRMLCRTEAIPLIIHGNIVEVEQVTFLLEPQSDIFLFLQVGKSMLDSSDPEPEVIVSAIGAYQTNNRKRECIGLHPLDTMTMPCMTMVGTRPTFYFVPVTRALADAVATGRQTSDRTEVLKCEITGYDGGMEKQEYRKVALQHLFAFKAAAESQWKRFLV
jgi:hypothetical protein